MIEEKTKEMFDGDELAISVWKGKYAAEGETHYDQMHRRMAKEFARIEKKYQDIEPFDASTLAKLSFYGYERYLLDEHKIYDLFKDFKYIVPQGSIMYGLGRTDKYISLSNCFVIESSKDSYGGILKTEQEQIQLMKRRGGVGHDISNLRPEGTEVSNSAGTSTGVVSFMERFSNGTREVAQSGRRGALMLSIDINHPDVAKFATIKSDLTKVTGANISIRVNDEFMKAVENDEDYILRFPCDIKVPYLPIKDIVYNELKFFRKPDGTPYYIKKIEAKELWNTIIEQARNNAEPGIMFWDNVMNSSPDSVYEQYRPICSNPCGRSWPQVKN